jgi:subtilisin family serine protease
MHTRRSDSRRFFTAPKLLTALTLLVATSPAGAGVIDPAYERYLDKLSEDQQVSVIIYLSEQVPLASLDAELKTGNATRALRHERVITSLRETAAASQGPLLADLAARKALGNARGFTPYWIANLVVAEMRVRDVREVAARQDVGIVYANFTASLIEPVDGDATLSDEPEHVAAATSGLCAINVRRVWSELGITGAGRLVAGLDTGVMGTHAALDTRWRGNHVEAKYAWRDLLGSNTTFPTDTHGHGTHTMGTMVGLGVATQDTVGVAWGAEWIACNAINQNVGPAFDNDVIDAFQWLSDPDGQAGTTDDVPDVVQNSWRINEGFGFNYIDCDPRWWAVIDACEAAGCAVVFSAGNEGPGARTIGSPPDRITTPTNGYAIGAVDAQNCAAFPYPIANFSSRGPSGCDGLTIKPEVVAPGVGVRSSTRNGSYGNMNGTSMAGPHVSGIFALLREANPDLDVTTMKQIIMDTARDLGAAGEDNTYGWGLVDAYAAVLAAMETSGIAANAPPATGHLRLVAVRPNPFNPASLVSYELANRTRIALRVYDLQGRRVRTLADGMAEAGMHSTIFDGRNDAGHDLASGTYFLRIEADGQRDVKKLSLVR